MNRNITIFILIILLSSCGLLENNEKRAIEVCKQSKVQFNMDNLLANLFFGAQGLNNDATWQDFANIVAQDLPNKRHSWTAQESDEKGVYIVEFTDELGWGPRWEVVLDEQMVKFINTNEFLSRKYGLSRFGDSEEFIIASTKLDTLRFYQKYRSSEPTIINEIKGTVLNNTDKVITGLVFFHQGKHLGSCPLHVWVSFFRQFFF